MGSLLAILIAALIIESIGVVYTSLGLKTLPRVERYTARSILRLAGSALVNRHIVLGVVLQALFFFALLYLLSQGDVSFIWPLTALSFVFTTFAARAFLGEKIPRLRWLGLLLIVIGAMLITYSEAEKRQAEKASMSPMDVNRGRQIDGGAGSRPRE